MKIFLNNSMLHFGVSPQDVVITDFSTETDILKKLEYSWTYTGVRVATIKACYIKVTPGDTLVLDNSDYNQYNYYILCESNPADWPLTDLSSDSDVYKNGTYYGYWCDPLEVKTITIPEGVEYIMVNYYSSTPDFQPLKSLTIKA